MSKTIFFISDILMSTNVHGFLDNFFALFQLPIKNATGIELCYFEVFEDSGSKHAFSRKRFFDLSNINVDLSAEHFFYQATVISDESLNYLRSFLSAEDIVIGHELSEQTETILKKCNITYLNHWTSPIRFMNDTTLAFKSNNAGVFQQFFDFKIPDEKIYQEANLQKLGLKTYWQKRNPIEPNSCLIIGQMMTDKAVLKQGKMLNITDFVNDVKQMQQQHNKLYYSRHPYVINDDIVLDFLAKSNIEVIEENTYRLFANNNVTSVCGISSSAILEARYFGKQIVYFHKPVVILGDTFSDNSAVLIEPLEYFKSFFWSKVLSPLLETKYVNDYNLENNSGKFRRATGSMYSFIDFKDIRQTRKLSRMQKWKNSIRKRLNKT